MTKRIFSILLISVFTFISVKADEGMWLPHLLQTMNEADMKAAGLQITAQDLYDVNNSSLKDAIVSLGGFCTAEVISSEGLLLTNHHCGFGQIQQHSSQENNYLEDGFWAMNKGEELPNEGLTASFLVSIESVTERVLNELGDVEESQRNAILGKIFNTIIDEKIDGTNYNARVKSFFEGNEFYLMTYIIYQDVRLVGAPPSSIGKFGGDTDNWMWPRHTGDFALFRIYCAPDGSPDLYSEDNIPYQPKHHLPIQLDGVENGDYTMVFGFPGSTDRYLTSYGVQEALEETNPTIVAIRDKKLEIMRKGMESSAITKLKYASKYARVSNYWKYYIGQSKGLKRMKVLDKKLKIEKDFHNWVIEGDDNRKEKYGNALSLIQEAYRDNKKVNIARQYLNEAVFQGAEIMYFSFLMHRQISSLSEEEEIREKQLESIKQIASEFYKDYDAEIDKELFANMLEMYSHNVPALSEGQNIKGKTYKYPPVIINVLNKYTFLRDIINANEFQLYAKKVFKKSIFTNEEKFLKFIDNNPKVINIENDIAYITIMSIYNFYLENYADIRRSVRSRLTEGNRLFIAGLREMNPDKKYYPDANSTMRLTYGTVGDYNPGDAVHYDYFTTIDGIMQKEDASNEEFIVDPKLKQLYEIGDYGRYADNNGNLRINFISNNDITGGNSGSPVINAWGELVGTAFDGNWEAMSGDIAFENQIQRTISVDIRYIMFIIDQFAGATHLINEMTIAESHH